MGRSGLRGLAVAVGIALSPGAGYGSPCGTQLPPQLRIDDCRVVRALEEGLEHSISLRQLVDRLGELKGMVFVSIVAGRRSGIQGGLLHKVSDAGGWLVLRVALIRDYAYGERTVPTLAHEFKHALEVLESPARTESEIASLFARIGYARAAGLVETDAALAIERRVASELKAKRRAARY